MTIRWWGRDPKIATRHSGIKRFVIQHKRVGGKKGKAYEVGAEGVLTPEELAELCQSGDLVWVGAGGVDVVAEVCSLDGRNVVGSRCFVSARRSSPYEASGEFCRCRRAPR